jgi:hypothetical protein
LSARVTHRTVLRATGTYCHLILVVTDQRQASLRDGRQHSKIYYRTASETISVSITAVAVIWTFLAGPSARIGIIAGQTGRVAEVVRTQIIVIEAEGAVSGGGAR